MKMTPVRNDDVYKKVIFGEDDFEFETLPASKVWDGDQWVNEGSQFKEIKYDSSLDIMPTDIVFVLPPITLILWFVFTGSILAFILALAYTAGIIYVGNLLRDMDDKEIARLISKSWKISD